MDNQIVEILNYHFEFTGNFSDFLYLSAFNLVISQYYKKFKKHQFLNVLSSLGVVRMSVGGWERYVGLKVKYETIKHLLN